MTVSVAAGPRNHRNGHSRRGRVGLSLFGPASGPFQDFAELPAQRDLEFSALFAGRQHDPVNQSPDRSCGRITLFRFAEGLREMCRRAAIIAGDVRVDVRDLGRNGCRAIVQFVLPSLQLLQLFLERGAVGPVLDGYNDPLNLLLDVLEFAAADARLFEQLSFITWFGHP